MKNIFNALVWILLIAPYFLFSPGSVFVVELIVFLILAVASYSFKFD